MKLNVIFSFRNEEENIPELISRVVNTLSKIKDLSYELIFVNDCSTDRSLEMLLDFKKTLPIKILNTSRKFGYHACALAGFSYADGDAIIYMDCDLQDPPELMPEMIARYRQGVDVVHTTRITRAGESFMKLLLTKWAYKIINFVSDISLPENTGDFKLLSSKALKQILQLREYDPYLRGLSVWIGFKQEFILYNREARFGGKSKVPLLGSLAPSREFIRAITSFSAAPLYIAIFIGLGSIGVSMSLITYALIAKALGIAAPGASGIIIAIAFFSGVILFTNGMIGMYIARIYNSIKGRPSCIIAEVI